MSAPQANRTGALGFLSIFFVYRQNSFASAQ